MSICNRIAYSPVVQGSMQQPNPKWDFFSLWSRHASNNLLWRILCELARSGSFEAPSSDFFSQDGANRYFTSLLALDSFDRGLPNLSLIQAKALFQKNDDFYTGIDKEQVAYESFCQSERECAATNERLLNLELIPERNDVECILFYAQRKIASILGEAPSFEDLPFSFGPGVSTSCKNKTSARWKLSAPVTLSSSLASSYEEISRSHPHWLSGKPAVLCHGELQFVPKNFKTYRSIIIEPLLNGYVQKGLGTVLKQKLLKSGVNLYDQSINRERARKGSLDGSLCTIDLERASDTLSYQLVMDLLPFDWFELFDAARTGYVKYRKTGEVIPLEKFSSMGNGFTFELESMVFYALSYGIAKHFDIEADISVFGDDIIVPRALFDRIVHYFPIFGFTPNVAKSFSDGPFRESCGGDYFSGVDVRPYFLRGLKSGGRFTYQSVFTFYNFLKRKPYFDEDKTIRKILIHAVPKHLLLFGPDGFGDGHLITDNLSEVLKPYKRCHGWGGFTFKTHTAVPTRDESYCAGDELLPLYLAGSGPTEDIYVLRTSGIPRSKVSRVYVPFYP